MSDSSFINPFTGQSIHISGTCRLKERHELATLIEQAGGVARSQLNSLTTILVVAGRRGAKAKRAEERGLLVWSEQQLIDELNRYHEHLAVAKPADRFASWEPAIDMSFDGPRSILGLPIADQAHQSILGSQQAYRLSHQNFYPIWEMSGAESLQALWLWYVSLAGFEQLASHWQDVPELRALLLNMHSEYLDTTTLLDGLPMLQVLAFSDSMAVEFSVTRHANLEQLILPGDQLEGLSLCSLPKLAYLYVSDKNVHQLQALLINKQCPRLAHIGLEGQWRLAEWVAELDNIENIQALTLNYKTRNPTGISDDLLELALLPIAQQLTHLTVCSQTYGLQGGISKAEFPQLMSLNITCDFTYEPLPTFIQDIAAIDLKQGFKLSFSGCNLSSAQAVEIVRGLKDNSSIAHVDFSGNRINARATQERLLRQSYSVNLAGQYRP